MVILVVLHLLQVRVQADTHAQIAAHLPVTEVYDSCAAFAVLELRNVNRLEFVVNFYVEAKSLQLLNLLLERAQNRCVLVCKWVVFRTLCREAGIVSGCVCVHFGVLHFTTVGF